MCYLPGLFTVLWHGLSSLDESFLVADVSYPCRFFGFSTVFEELIAIFYSYF